MGFVNILVTIGKWKAVLLFYVLNYGTHLIVGYPYLKALKLSLNDVLDKLMGEDGEA